MRLTLRRIQDVPSVVKRYRISQSVFSRDSQAGLSIGAFARALVIGIRCAGAAVLGLLVKYLRWQREVAKVPLVESASSDIRARARNQHTSCTDK